MILALLGEIHHPVQFPCELRILGVAARRLRCIQALSYNAMYNMSFNGTDSSDWKGLEFFHSSHTDGVKLGLNFLMPSFLLTDGLKDCRNAGQCFSAETRHKLASQSQPYAKSTIQPMFTVLWIDD